jgi:hypothetical protein
LSQHLDYTYRPGIGQFSVGVDSDEVSLAAIHCVVSKSAANLRTLVPSARNTLIFSMSD